MTDAQHAAMRDMVVRSLLVSSSRSERSEERPRKHVRVVAPVFPVAPSVHRYVFPVVTERPL